MTSLLLFLLLGTKPAFALIDQKCKPEYLALQADDTGYSDEVQSSFLQNRFALVSMFAPAHGPIPYSAGRGSVGTEITYIPLLNCDQVLAEGHSKTEAANPSPVLPRFYGGFSLPEIGGSGLWPYLGFVALPPIGVAGTHNVGLGTEFGVGTGAYRKTQFGIRGHLSVQWSIADVATREALSDPDYYDVYIGSVLGADVSIGHRFAPGSGWMHAQVTPYLSAGIADASTYFWVGDDGQVPVNVYPYLGPVCTLGLDSLLLRQLRVSISLEADPGGHRDLTGDAPDGFAVAGNLYTGRLQLGWEPPHRIPPKGESR